MGDVIAGLLAWSAGGFIGAMFFGGLWWTVRKGLTSTRPALWFGGSLMLRTSAALGGFYLVSAGHWQRLVLCLIGFAMARPLATRLTRGVGRGGGAPSLLEAAGAPDPR